jgi:hypothetical protein
MITVVQLSKSDTTSISEGSSYCVAIESDVADARSHRHL